MSNVRGQLTHYPEGSIKELWSISFPLILSILSINVMTFMDRLILAKYDTHAMNAAVVAGLVFSIFQYGTIGIAAISEVFVGQYNGAKKLKKIGEPVWQMIWFSLATAVLFLPLGLFAGSYFVPNPEYMNDGIPFFQWMMIFGPAFPLVAALSSFFVGRGRVKLVMTTTILSNLLNILLDFILIFGIEGWFSPLGAKGAAIATGVAQTTQALLLLLVFLRRRHRETHGTGEWQFKPRLFLQAFHIGLPSALSSVIELSAWTVLAQILTHVSEAHITIFSIGDSFFVLFAFGFWGLQKGITTVVSNYIGANREEVVNHCLKSGLKIISVIMVIFTIPLFFFPETLIEHFLNPTSTINDELMQHGALAMRWLWVYFMLDAISLLICGVLTAVGDTKFVMFMNGLSAWLFSIIPIYFCVVYLEGSPVIPWVLFAVYGLLNAISFYFRYRSKRWSSEQPIHALG